MENQKTDRQWVEFPNPRTLLEENPSSRRIELGEATDTDLSDALINVFFTWCMAYGAACYRNGYKESVVGGMSLCHHKLNLEGVSEKRKISRLAKAAFRVGYQTAQL